MNIYVDLITKGIKALNDYFQFDFIYAETYIASEYSKESKNV